MSAAEAAARFGDVPEAVAATADIAEECRLDLGGGKKTSPVFDFPGEQAAELLRRFCTKAIPDRYPGTPAWTDRHRNRLNKELAVFETLGFSAFMVVVAEILVHCRREGIPVIARGSAVSSLVLHLLGGSPVDPLAHGLIFERFLHPEKSAWPDVDLDLPWHRRDEVIAWVYERFGRDRVAMVAAHHTFQYRSALREGLKAWGARPALTEMLSRALPPEDLPVEEVDFIGLAAAAGVTDPMAELDDRYRETTGLQEILPLIRRLVGRPHHIAAHPGGIVVDRRPLEDLLPSSWRPRGS